MRYSLAVHEELVVVCSQRQQKNLPERKVFEERDELLDLVVMRKQPGALHSQKIDREHNLQIFQKDHLIVGVNSLLKRPLFFLLVRSGFYEDLRNGGGYRISDGFVPRDRICQKKDICSENECRELQIRHIPVKKLEEKMLARL